METNAQDRLDVVVIGGGPAGSTIATYLSRKGFKVQVLEREEFPREHVGESLLPFCFELFRELGVLDEMKRRFVRKPGVRFIDVDGKTFTTWCFDHVIKDESAMSFHVLRAEFDELLLRNAEKSGAMVKERTRVQSVDIDGPDGDAIVTARTDGQEPVEYRTRFVIDASGRDTLMASRLKLKKANPHLDRTAISTHWTGARYEGGIEEGLLQICYLGGEKQGWIWVIPVTKDRVSIGVVMNHSYIAAQKAKLTAAGSADWREDLYRQELDGSLFVKGILTDAKRLMPLMFNGDYSYSVDRKYGSNFALVGDAATFIDPIFASGVYLCMNSSRLVAGAVEARLREPAMADAKFEQAYATINGAYTLVDRAIRMFYNSEALNFAQVGHVAGDVYLRQQDMMAVGHYLLAGDFFNNHERYFNFLELLQTPIYLAKYKATVIDPRSHATGCSIAREEVFSALIDEYEADRQKLIDRAWSMEKKRGKENMKMADQIADKNLPM